MITTKRLAAAFHRHRLMFAALVGIMFVLSTTGHYLKQGDRFDWLKRGASRRDERAVRVLRGVKSTFDLQRADCFMLLEAEDIFQPRAAAAVSDVVNTVESLPQVQSVLWMGDMPSMNVFGLTDSLLPSETASQAQFEAARSRALEHPLVAGQLLSRDSTAVLLIISIDWLQFKDDASVSADLLTTARMALERHTGAHVRAGLTGDIPLFLAQRAVHKKNERKFQIIGYALVAIVAVLLFRGLVPVLILSGAAATGIYWSLGFLHLLQWEINPLTAAVLPVMLAMVGVSDGVHLMVHMREKRAAGMSPIDASRSAIEHVGLPCLLTSLTTAIGFGSLMLAESEFVRSFGQACSLGVLMTFVAVVTIIPLIASTRLGRNLDKGQQRDFIGHHLQRTSWVVDAILRRRRVISWTGIATTLVLALISLQLRPDNKLSRTLPSSSAAYKTLARCDELFGGIEFVRIVVQWPEQMNDESGEIFSAVTAADQLAREEPLLANPLSLANVLTAFPGDSNLPDDRMAYLDLMPEQLKQVLLNPDSNQALITLRVQDVGIAQYKPVFTRLQEKLQTLGDDFPGFEFDLTGDPIVRGQRLHQVVVDLATSLGAAALVIMAMIAVVYRSLRLGLIAVVPNMFPLVVTAAILVATGHSLDISSVCAFTVCLGIAVDDTIHFLSRYQEESQEHGQEAAIKRTYVQVGTALVMTTVVMVAGFATVISSDLPQQRTFAAMACCTIAAALFGDLLFLPAMLGSFIRHGKGESKVEDELLLQHHVDAEDGRHD